MLRDALQIFKEQRRAQRGDKRAGISTCILTGFFIRLSGQKHIERKFLMSEWHFVSLFFISPREVF